MKESHGRGEHCGRLAEDEKIREDSNEGLDSSSSNGGSSSTNDDDDVAFDAATAVTAVLLAIQLKQKQQLCFQNGDDSTAMITALQTGF